MFQRSSEPRPRHARRALRQLTLGTLATLVAFGGSGALGATPAAAAADVDGPATLTNGIGLWSPVNGVSLTDFDASTVRVDVSVTGAGVVRYTGSHSGVTAVPGFANDPDNGVTHLALTGSQAALNSALGALQFRGSTIGSATITVEAINAPAFFNPDNGHYYQVIATPDPITATDAIAAATTAEIVVGGTTHHGYLATITSAQENAFLASRAVTYGWIGATDRTVEGDWTWVTGPEAGTVFCVGNDPCAAQGGHYQNWAQFEPNNFDGSEHYAVINWDGNGTGTWNDLPDEMPTVSQYIVEYGSGGPLAAPAGATTSIAVTIVTPAEPGAPTAVNATPGNASAVVSWSAPTNDGGSPVTSYTVTAQPGGAGCSTDAPSTSCTVTGLTNGQPYLFTVRATNAIGEGAPGTTSAGVTPNDAPPPGYEPLPQTRLIDTRRSDNGPAPAAGDTVHVPLGGGAIPANTTAVLVNLTGVNATDAGFVTIHPCGSPTPHASSLNVIPGQEVANLAIVRVPAGATALCAFTSTGVDVVVDLVGAFSGELPAGLTQPGGAISLARAPFLPATPARLVDTRERGVPVLGGSHLELDVADLQGVPADATAVVVTVTTDRAEGPGFVTAYSCTDGRPPTSTLNLDPAAAIANLAVLPIHDGRVCIYTQTTTDIIVDLVGSFAPSHDSVMTVIDHHRVLDTRIGLGAPVALRPHQPVRLDLRGVIAPDAVAVALNVTATDSSDRGWVRVWACGTPMPPTSNLNPVVGRAVPNVVLTSVGTGADAGAVCIMSHAPTDLVVDVQGWFSRV